MYRFLGESAGCPSVSLSVSSSRLCVSGQPIFKGEIVQKSVKLLLEPLKVGHVARGSEDRMRAERVQTLDIAETRQRTVRACR